VSESEADDDWRDRVAAEYARRQEPGFAEQERARVRAEYNALTPQQRRAQYAWLERHSRRWRELDPDTAVQRTIIIAVIAVVLAIVVVVALVVVLVTLVF